MALSRAMQPFESGRTGTCAQDDAARNLLIESLHVVRRLRGLFASRPQEGRLPLWMPLVIVLLPDKDRGKSILPLPRAAPISPAPSGYPKPGGLPAEADPKAFSRCARPGLRIGSHLPWTRPRAEAFPAACGRLPSSKVAMQPRAPQWLFPSSSSRSPESFRGGRRERASCPCSRLDRDTTRERIRRRRSIPFPTGCRGRPGPPGEGCPPGRGLRYMRFSAGRFRG